MDVSKNRNTPKWMVKIRVPNPIKMDDVGVPLFLETPIYTRIPSCHTLSLRKEAEEPFLSQGKRSARSFCRAFFVDPKQLRQCI